MNRSLLAYGLILLIVAAVLRFGGTDPLVFSAVQAGVFLLTVAALWRVRDRQPLTHPVLLLPLLLAAYAGLQWVLLSESRAVIGHHLPRLFAYLCVFALAFLLGQDRRLHWRMVVSLLVLGGFEALYGLAQYLASWPYIFQYRNIFFADRATGTYINPNHFAGFLAMVLPLALGVSLGELERRRLQSARSGGERLLDGQHTPRLLFWSFLTLLLFLAVLFSLSRMGIFSAVAAMLAVGLLWGSASWRRARVVPVLIVFLLAAGALGVWLGLEPVIVRYASVEDAYVHRSAIWRDTLELIAARPLLGSGLGTFAVRYTSHQTTMLGRLVDHAHNDYLQFTAELGLAGALLLFALIFSALGRMLAAFYRHQPGRERLLLAGCLGGALAILFHGLADFNLQLPANAMVFAALLGLGCARSELSAELLPPRAQDQG